MESINQIIDNVKPIEAPDVKDGDIISIKYELKVIEKEGNLEFDFNNLDDVDVQVSDPGPNGMKKYYKKLNMKELPVAVDSHSDRFGVEADTVGNDTNLPGSLNASEVVAKSNKSDNITPQRQEEDKLNNEPIANTSVKPPAPPFDRYDKFKNPDKYKGFKTNKDFKFPSNGSVELSYPKIIKLLNENKLNNAKNNKEILAELENATTPKEVIDVIKQHDLWFNNDHIGGKTKKRAFKQLRGKRTRRQ